ncbi:MAG TPA: ATP-binding protein [Methanosarcinaceae archaeon]|nr:ATP-binding protein [Methanosarcinaceae archaeon]
MMTYEEILIKQNRHWREEQFTIGVIRDVRSEIVPFLKTKYVLAITGVRRSGKSYLLYQLIDALLENKPPENILYINFDDPAYVRIRNDPQGFDGLYGDYLKLKNPKGKTFLFLDEVQSVPGWEKWIKSKYDMEENIKFIITGSNASLLSSELSTLLTGRNLQFEVFPFNLAEFLRLNDEDVFTSSDVGAIYEKNYGKKDTLRHYVAQILKYGTFPEILQIEEGMREMILKEYYKDILYRDIVPRFEVRHANKLEEVAYYLLTNISNAVSYHKIGKLIGVNEVTIKDYFSYFEKSYLSFNIHKFAFSLKEQIRNPKKVYFIDCGMRNAISFRFSEDTGRLMENVVFIELRRRGKEIFYWKNKNEVDFVIKQGLEVTELIQVSYDVEDKKTRMREEAGLITAMDTFGLDVGIIITDDKYSVSMVDDKKIMYIPLWAWMLIS